MGCKHSYQYSRGKLRCSKCNKISHVQMYKKNNNKTYAAAVIVGIAILVAIVVNANYDIKVNNQDISEMIPVNQIENTLGKISDSIPVDQIKNTFEDITESIPVKLEAKPETLESKLEDCSKYKNEVKYSTDFGEVFVAVQKTKECEQRNKQITIKYGSVTTQSANYPTVTVSMDNRSGGATADFKINTVRVVNSDNYKIININMLMTVHMKLQDQIYFSPTALWVLKSSSGEIYPEQCHGQQADMMTITGKQNPNITWDICYHVEKDLNAFDLLKSSTKIGTIILD